MRFAQDAKESENDWIVVVDMSLMLQDLENTCEAPSQVGGLGFY